MAIVYRSDNISQIDALQDLKARNKALEKKVALLTWRLEQRERATKKDFEALKPYFESIRLRILTIFQEEIPVTQGLTHPELQSIFAEKYPNAKITDIPRRVRELVDEKKLWRRDDDDGTARFFLVLKEEASVSNYSFNVSNETKEVS